jgi:DNA integrity scanning protein DisA with diadenylate cyclase activity
MHELEAFVYGEMVKKLQGFKTLTGRKKTVKANPKLTAKQLELARVESEIEKLIESLTTAGATLVIYVNAKIEELDARRQTLIQDIAALTLDTIPPAQMEAISNYLDDWNNVNFEDKQKVLDYLVTRIRATCESVEIEWKI